MLLFLHFKTIYHKGNPAFYMKTSAVIHAKESIPTFKLKTVAEKTCCCYKQIKLLFMT